MLRQGLRDQTSQMYMAFQGLGDSAHWFLGQLSLFKAVFLSLGSGILHERTQGEDKREDATASRKGLKYELWTEGGGHFACGRQPKREES